MEGRKAYLQPMDMVVLAIYDLIEMQKGRLLAGDSATGSICFQISIYDTVWEYHVLVTDIGHNRCGVTVKLVGDERDKVRLIEHVFALLDYVLIDRARIDFANIEEEDRSIIASRRGRNSI